MSESIPKCIECGGAVNSLNEDDEGVPCPACSERLLETLPGVFHSPWGSAPAPAEASEEAVGDEAASDEPTDHSQNA